MFGNLMVTLHIELTLDSLTFVGTNLEKFQMHIIIKNIGYFLVYLLLVHVFIHVYVYTLTCFSTSS